jgi:hypothetical protein
VSEEADDDALIVVADLALREWLEYAVDEDQGPVGAFAFGDKDVWRDDLVRRQRGDTDVLAVSLPTERRPHRAPVVPLESVWKRSAHLGVVGGATPYAWHTTSSVNWFAIGLPMTI